MVGVFNGLRPGEFFRRAQVLIRIGGVARSGCACIRARSMELASGFRGIGREHVVVVWNKCVMADRSSDKSIFNSSGEKCSTAV